MDQEREAYWRGKLSEFWIGPEPVEAKVKVRFYATLVMTGLLTMIGLCFLAIFVAFERLDVGLRIFGLIFVPAVLKLLIDHAILRRRVRAYVRERGDPSIGNGPPG